MDQLVADRWKCNVNGCTHIRDMTFPQPASKNNCLPLSTIGRLHYACRGTPGFLHKRYTVKYAVCYFRIVRKSVVLRLPRLLSTGK